MKTRATSNSILIFTCSEFGQANINLAVLYELLHNTDGFDIHIVSHQRLKERVDSITINSDRKARFHAIPIPTLQDFMVRCKNRYLAQSPGLKAASVFPELPTLLAGYTNSEYVSAYDSCVKIIQAVRPACAVVDVAFPLGFDACHAENVPTLRISPTLLYHSVYDNQSNLALFCKFPFAASGLSYPIPWYYVPLNAYMVFRFTQSFAKSARITKLKKLHREALESGQISNNASNKLTGCFKPIVSVPDIDFAIYRLTTGLPELDFPVHVPNNVIPCGPIVLPSKPVEEADPELATWLKRGSGTLLVQMGTLWDSDGEAEKLTRNISEIARGICVLLDKVPKIQVLWKVKIPPKPDSPSMSATNHPLSSTEDPTAQLSPHLGSRVRIVPWLQVDPSSILSSGHIIAIVHHGGGNSYGEATRAGVPQIVLPPWLDCYDFAVRAEYFGFGVWGNKSVAPAVDGEELWRALTKVVGERVDGTTKIREKAKQVGEMVRGKGEGRVKAVDAILNVAREQVKKTQN